MLEVPPLLSVKRPARRPTAAQIAAFQDVPTSFVVDSIDGTGALSSAIRPVGEGRDIDCRAAGPALTVGNGPGDVLATLAAPEFIQPGDIVVATSAGHQGCAAAGDRVIGAVRNSGAAGFVSDGPLRDYAGIVAVGLPVWCTGLTPASPFKTGPGRIGHPIQIGGQRVESGDVVVADFDGVVIVPFDRIAEVLECLERVKKLEAARDAEVAAGLRVSAATRAILDSDRTRFED